MTDDLGPSLEQAIGEAISEAVGQHERGFVLKWVALVESVNPEGERGLWALTSDDVTAWDTKGMLVDSLDRLRQQELRGEDE